MSAHGAQLLNQRTKQVKSDDANVYWAQPARVGQYASCADTCSSYPHTRSGALHVFPEERPRKTGSNILDGGVKDMPLRCIKRLLPERCSS